MSIVIIGAGEVGVNLATRLSQEKKDVVLIEKNQGICSNLEEILDCQVLQGQGSTPGILSKAQIQSSEVLVAVAESDETNLMACLVASKMNPNLVKIARVRDEGYYLKEEDEKFKLELPVDIFIHPEKVAADKIFSILSYPEIIDCESFAENKLLMLGLNINSDSRYAYRKVFEIQMSYPELPLLILAYKRDEEIFIASKDTEILPGDILYLITDPDIAEKVIQIFTKRTKARQRIMVIGGDRLSWILTKKLIQIPGVHVKHVEKNEQNCPLLQESSNQLIFLVGKSTDQAFLTSENIQEVDAFVAASPNEEDNLLAALLAKKLGAKMVFSRLNKSYYFPIANAVGIDVVISPRILAAGDIVRTLRKGKIMGITNFLDANAEIIEVEALETSDLVEKPIKDINLPKQAKVAGIVRGEEVIIPNDETVIRPKDRVVIFALSEAIKAIEKALTVKLSFF